MSLGGSSESSQQLDPAFRDLFIGNYQGAQGVASGLGARQFSGFNPDQEQAFALNRELARTTSAPNLYATEAANTLMQRSNYTPQNVNYQGYTPTQAPTAERATAAQLNRGSIRDVSSQDVTGANVAREALTDINPFARASIRDVAPGSFLNQNIQQYMNPYTQAVTDRSLQDLERSRQLQQQQTAAQATAAKAFGGSRQGVAEAETNRAYGENAARLVAQQNAAAFDAASRLSEADLARSMQAQQLNQAQDLATTQQSLQLAGQFGLANQDAALRAALANQGIDLSTGQLNTQNAQQVALANALAGNQMSQFNAAQQQTAGLANAQNRLQASLANQGAGLQANQQNIGAASQLANAATNLQNLGFAQSNQLRDQGLIQQGFSQQQLDAIRNLPLEQQQILNQALGINVGGGSGMQSSSSSGQGLFGLFR